MEFWLFLPQIRYGVDEVVDLAQAAEGCGLAGIAFIDHLVPPLAEAQPVHEAMTLATWVAARTSTLRIGHLVLCDPLRHPAVLAKQAVTLDHASGGRFELGIGWGSSEYELAAFGVTTATAKERAARLVETVTTLRALWSGAGVGPDDARQAPLPLGRLPLVIGGVGPTALRLAREHADWWNVTAPKVDKLDAVRESVAPARVSVQVMVALDRPGAAPGAASEWAQRRFPMFGEGLIGGSAEEVAERLAGFAARGVERVYLWLAPPPDVAAIEALAAALD